MKDYLVSVSHNLVTVESKEIKDEYANEQEIMRLLYLIFLYNSGQYIQKVQFLDEEINIMYANNNQIQFYFEMLKPYNKDGFENRITNNLNTMLIVSKSSNIEGNEQAIGKQSVEKEGNLVENRIELDKLKIKGSAAKNKMSIAKEIEDKFEEEEPEEEEKNGNVELIEGEDEDDKGEEKSNEVDRSNKMEENDKEFGEFKSDITLTGNKLKATKLYKEFLLLEKGLLVVALFFDDNAQVHKSNYYNNVKKHLKTIIHQSSTSEIIQFDSLLINGALSIDLYQEEQESAASILLEFDDGNLRDQINLLRKLSKLLSNILTNTSISSNTNDQQILIFSSLMKLYQRMSLRFLYEFELAYCYMKDFVIKYTSHSKEIKSTIQINALLTGRIILQQLLNIQSTTSETFLVHQPIKKNKKN
ncbi:4807_t:CDS:2 [Gigaspora margarita]|uniref:4807_t:CDS:1 n=1 Tax=Gigaspora margarita TaxID=4874 RepID=A0ABN7VP67_GIGMA|nr:4807_t:CDS:2 [Gigaspora margarita]